jgi:hypothetical protein
MLSGYPPAFFMPIKAFLKAWWVSTSLFYANKRLLNAWSVSTSLFYANKRLLKCLVCIHQPFLCQ